MCIFAIVPEKTEKVEENVTFPSIIYSQRKFAWKAHKYTQPLATVAEREKNISFLEPEMPSCALCTHLYSLLFVESWGESESDWAILSGPGAFWLRSGSE